MSFETSDCTDTGRFERHNALKEQFDWTDVQGPAMAIVEITARLTGREQTELEPLNNVVNTDALNRLFSPNSESTRLSGTVEIEYEGCLIRLQGDGTVSAVRAKQS